MQNRQQQTNNRGTFQPLISLDKLNDKEQGKLFAQIVNSTMNFFARELEPKELEFGSVYPCYPWMCIHD